MPLNKPTGDLLAAGSTQTPAPLGTAAAGTSTSYSKGDHVHQLPIATASVLGTVKIGSNLSITSQGLLSANATPTPIATTTSVGTVSVGDNLTITAQGRLSATATPTPIATTTTAGTIIVGEGLAVSSQGVLSANGIAAPATEFAITEFISDGSSLEYYPITGYSTNDPAAYFVSVDGIDQSFTISETNGGTVIIPSAAPAGVVIRVRAAIVGASSTGGNATLIQGRSVNSVAPVAGQVLSWDGFKWVPTDPTILRGFYTSSSDGTFTTPYNTFYTITGRGADGSAGTDGADGNTDGTNGEDGIDGIAGRDCTITWEGQPEPFVCAGGTEGLKGWGGGGVSLGNGVGNDGNGPCGGKGGFTSETPGNGGCGAGVGDFPNGGAGVNYGGDGGAGAFGGELTGAGGGGGANGSGGGGGGSPYGSMMASPGKGGKAIPPGVGTTIQRVVEFSAGTVISFSFGPSGNVSNQSFTITW